MWRERDVTAFKNCDVDFLSFLRRERRTKIIVATHISSGVVSRESRSNCRSYSYLKHAIGYLPQPARSLVRRVQIL